MSKEIKPALVLDAFLNKIWAIQPAWLESMYKIIDRQNDIRPVLESGQFFDRQPGAEAFRIENGKAIIPVFGPIFPRANLITAMSGASSVERIESDFKAALNDPAVTEIILDFDSPGGEVTGISDLGKLIFESRGQKKITAFVSGTAASAAFWIAAQADEIIVSDTSHTGSIGVLVAFLDDREKLKMEGLKEIILVSNLSPNKLLDPAKKADQDTIVTMLDEMTEVFIAAVGQGRDVSRETILEKFGQGAIFLGGQAVEVGLVDKLGTLDGLIKSNENSNNNISQTEVKTMNEDQLKAEHPATYNSIFEKGKEVGASEAAIPHAEAVLAARSEAATEESARIQDIETLAGSGNEKLINDLKFDPKENKGTVAMAILEATKDKKKKLKKDKDEDEDELNQKAAKIEAGTEQGSKEEEMAGALATMNKANDEKYGSRIQTPESV